MPPRTPTGPAPGSPAGLLRGGGLPTAGSRASSLAGDAKADKRASQRKGAALRAHSVATLVLQTPSAHLPVVCRLSLSTDFDVRVQAQLRASSPEGPALPEVCRAGSTVTVTYVSNNVILGLQTSGTLTLEGFESVPFTVAHAKPNNTFVGAAGRRRYQVLRSERWDWRAGGDKPESGQAADLEIAGTQLRVQLRQASAAELRRCLQLQALRDAEAERDYDTIHAQLSKAKTAGVEREHMEHAEELLKVLRKQGLHVHVGCEKDTLRDQMSWDKVTSRSGSDDVKEPCYLGSDCPCNEGEGPGEVLEVKPGAVQEILGEGTDKELFEELASAALVVEEGSVWKAGGKFIFSAFNRNQSVIALTRMLENFGKQRCAKMLLDLVKISEKKYSGFVTAVQINFHPNGMTFHDQHRDIYSGKQRAGPNCTCSFRECVGTVCYSLGSSRLCQLDTMVDESSSIQPCCESCSGSREKRWLHSGEAMYFNGPWNQNHTHGIPTSDEEAGPRISIAFLLGAQTPLLG